MILIYLIYHLFTVNSWIKHPYELRLTKVLISKAGAREATTIDLDMTSGQFVQFTIKLGCDSALLENSRRNRGPWKASGKDNFFGSELNEEDSIAPVGREEGVLVQYSDNGGVNWELLKVK